MTTFLSVWTTSPTGRMSDHGTQDHYCAFETLTEARSHFAGVKDLPTTAVASITIVIDSTDY